MLAFGVFLVRIFPHLDWIGRDTEYLSVVSPNAEKCRSEKLRIRTLFTQCRNSRTAKEAYVGPCQTSMFFEKVVFSRQLFPHKSSIRKRVNILLSYFSRYRREFFFVSNFIILFFYLFIYFFIYLFFWSNIKGKGKFWHFMWIYKGTLMTSPRKVVNFIWLFYSYPMMSHHPDTGKQKLGLFMQEELQLINWT